MTSHGKYPDFNGAHFGLVSLHDKASIIAPALAERWQARLTSSTAFDTDSLGTFSGEIERRLSPVECALDKARRALALTGAEFGLGSEGSFGPAPWGFGIFNQELVACVPAEGTWSVVGRHVTPVAVTECRYGDTRAVAQFWENLPAGQGVMLIGEGLVAKGILSKEAAMAQLAQWYGEKIPHDLRISYDLRAHQSPLRRVSIAHAVANLLERLASACEGCGQPGFWPDHHETGLPCGNCGCPTNSLRVRTSRCEGCGYQVSSMVEASLADPATCPM